MSQQTLLGGDGVTGESGATHNTKANANFTELYGATATAQSTADAAGNAVSSHISDATAAHAGSAISFTPAGGLSSTDVQAAIVELAGAGGVADASTTVKGIVELATDAETTTGTSTTLVTTPANVKVVSDTKVDKETWTTLTDSSSVTWNTANKQSPIAKLTSTQSFTLILQNLKDGAHGILKLTTNTASAITVDPDDTTYTFKSVDNATITDHTFPAATGKDYYIEFVVQGTTVLIVFNDYTDAPATVPSIVCSLERTSNQTITTATFTSVQFVTEVSDLHNMFNSGTSTTTITVPGSGAKLASIFMHSTWAVGSTGIRRIRLLINGSNPVGREFDDKTALSIAMTHNLFTSTVVAGGDTLQMQVYHTQGSDLAISGAFICVEIKDIA